MNELFLYDRDAGLFKEILKFSTVIEGRYFVLADGNDMNTANFRQYISDALNGLQAAGQKYPAALCLPPRSTPDGTRELFLFTMFFLTRSGTTGNNQIKEVNVDTQTSTHHAWYDWKDMKECAVNFLSVLKKTIKTGRTGDTLIRSFVTLLSEGTEITRISNIGTDNVSGVRISFRMEMNVECETNDYDNIESISIPELNIHPLHKH